MKAVNRAAVQIARDAVRKSVRLGIHWPPRFARGICRLGPNPAVAPRCGCTAAGKPWSDQIEPAIRQATDSANNPRRLPVLLSLSFLKPPEPGARPCLPSGMTAMDAARLASSLPVAALGVNCGRDVDLADVTTILNEYRAATDLPLFARPNAGTPRATAAGWSYSVTPDDFADHTAELFAAGARLIGGCCGTTPAHIAALAKRLDGI